MEETDVSVNKNSQQVINIIKSILDKGANYVIKSMPVNKHIKDILINVKEVINEKDFANILDVAIRSSIKDGMQMVGLNKSDIEEIDRFVDTAFKGGLANCVNIGIDIISAGKECGNIFYTYIEDFFDKLKSFVKSPDFKAKIYSNIEKCLDKVDTFKELCNDWYDAYDKFNMSDIKEIAGKLNKLKNKVDFNNDCINENAMIQNVTEFVGKRNRKLSKVQFDIYTGLNQI